MALYRARRSKAITDSIRRCLGDRLRRAPHEDLEVVWVANAWAAMVLGGLSGLHWQLSFEATLVAVIASFVTLTACLFNRCTAWISAILGGAALSLAPAALLVWVGLGVSPLGAWLGGAVGLAIGTGTAVISSRQVANFLRPMP